MAEPIEIPASPAGPQAMAALRTLLMTAGGYFVGKGVVSADQLAIIVPAVLTLGVFVWSQWATHKNATKAAIAAEAAPNTVAKAV